MLHYVAFVELFVAILKWSVHADIIIAPTTEFKVLLSSAKGLG